MPYLAMTAAEILTCDPMPPKLGWMACHFSPYGTGLTNLPQNLPKGSLLILNDRTPIHGHDPQRIFDQLEDVICKFSCGNLLLDLQRPCQEAPAIIEKLLALPCPVITSQLHGENLDTPIFLPPVPLNVPPKTYLECYHGREIWLEIALDALQVTITEKGSDFLQIPWGDESLPHKDSELFCHYKADISQEKVVFTLKRTKDDLSELLDEVKRLGVTHTVGLYQELRSFHPSSI